MHRAVVILALLVASPALAAPPPELSRAQDAFDRSDYKQVIAVLAPAIPLMRDEKDLTVAHYLLAESYFFVDDTDRAQQEFTALLVLNPQFELDPAVDPPKVFAFFANLKRDLHTKLDEIERIKAAELAEKNRPKNEIVVTRVVREPTRLDNLIPLGYGQFKNGEPGKGWFFLGAELATGGTSASLFLAQALEYGIPSHVARTDTSAIDGLRTRQLLQIGTGSLFLVLYTWQILDAYAHQKPRISETKTIQPIPVPTAILPSVGPDSVGLSASWSF